MIAQISAERLGAATEPTEDEVAVRTFFLCETLYAQWAKFWVLMWSRLR